MARKHTETQQEPTPLAGETLESNEPAPEISESLSTMAMEEMTSEPASETSETLSTMRMEEMASEPSSETSEIMTSETMEEAGPESPTHRSFSGAIREGASDARHAAAKFIPTVGRLVHNGVYGGFYRVTYGLVFGSLVVGSMIPTNNAMGEGIRDGVRAARRAFEEKKKAAHEAETAEVSGGEELATA